MLVLAPKRASTIEDPECVVKVQVHEQIEEYKQTFDYYIQTTVTTLWRKYIGTGESNRNYTTI